MRKNNDFEMLSPTELVALSESTVDDFRHNRGDIYRAAAAKYQEAGDEEHRQCMVYEALAFDLSPHKTGGHRFGCEYGLVYSNGEEIQYPDRDKDFTDTTIDYYKQRTHETTNPILKARYADVIWDLKPKGNYVYAKLAFGSYLACADIYLANMDGDNYWGIELADALVRALEISVQIKSDTLVDCVLEKHSEVAGKLAVAKEYAWILDPLRSIAGKEKLKHRVDIEHLRTLAQEAVQHYREIVPDSFDMQRSFLEIIADLWKLERNKDKIDAAKREIAATYEDEADFKRGSHLIAAVVLEKALQAYVELGDSPSKVAELKTAIEREHQLAQGEYRLVESKVQVEKQTIDAWLAPYQSLGVSECLLFLSADPNILPSYEEACAKAAEQAKEFVLDHIFPTRIDRKGMTVKTVVEEDEHLAYSAAVNFRMHYVFAATLLLPHLFQLLKDKDEGYLEVVRSHIAQCGVFEPERAELIGVGLAAFGREDYVGCLHILVSQAEGALRDFLGMLGMPKTNFLGIGMWEAQALNRILDVLATVQGFERDFVWLIRLLLADKVGDNLRNEIAHGLTELKQFNPRNAMLLVYIFVKLATYQIKQSADSVAP